MTGSILPATFPLWPFPGILAAVLAAVVAAVCRLCCSPGPLLPPRRRRAPQEGTRAAPRRWSQHKSTPAISLCPFPSGAHDRRSGTRLQSVPLSSTQSVCGRRSGKSVLCGWAGVGAGRPAWGESSAPSSPVESHPHGRVPLRLCVTLRASDTSIKINAR